jgi:chromosome segregation ATPase
MVTALKTTDTETTLHAAEDSAASLSQRLSENAQAQEQARQELASIHRARQDRTHHLSEAHASIASLDKEHEKAVIEAKLTQGTAKEHVTVKAVSEVQKGLKAAKNALVQAEQTFAEQEHASATREQELIALLTRLQAEQGRLQSEQSHTLDIVAMAHAEAGREKQAAILARLKEHQNEVDQARALLLTTQIEQHDFLDHAIQSLSNWPELQREIAGLQLKTDSVTVLALAALQYLEVAAKEAPGLKNRRDIRIPIAAGTMENLFAIQQNEIAEAANGWPDKLNVRMGHLKQVLAQ